MTDKKNSLNIRLTESAVFLRIDSTRRRNGAHDSQASMLRGLLILDLCKPTRITSIAIELLAKSSNAWPEGIGARRTDITEEHTLFRAETTYFDVGKERDRRYSSIGPGASYGPEEAGYESDEQHNSLRSPLSVDQDVRRGANTHSHHSRRRSADNSYFQRSPLSHEEFSVIPTPPYSPFTPHSPPGSDQTPQSPRHNLEEFRSHINAGIGRSPTGFAIAASGGWPHRPDHSLSRRPSMQDILENEPGWITPTQLSPPTSRPSSRLGSRPTSRPPSPPISPGAHNVSRGRPGSRSRFNLSSVSTALMDAVRSASPKTPSETHENTSDGRRGRPKEKFGYTHSPSPSTSVVRGRSKERSTFGRILKIDPESTPSAAGWKELKKGIYTYPISFSIPGNSPPTLHCSYGTVIWRLRATVHRPGTFKSKMVVNREVDVIACPSEDDTEDTENIIVERHWDNQLQYLISISGRSFYIGGAIPITLTLMPLDKIKIHRISIFVEERVDYYSHMKRIARTDPLTYYPLLSIKDQARNARHILPLDSDDVYAFKKSPLRALLAPEGDASEMASSLMGPGPWSFHQDLKLPESCELIHTSNKNRRSNLIITHQLKCILRVERSDNLHVDPKTGKPKLFDIVVQTPIQILSCRCNPEWTSLPRYSESFDNTSTVVPKCPCSVRRVERSRAPLPARPHVLERMASNQSSDSNIAAAETHPIIPGMMPSLRQSHSLFSQNTQFERLISGQESETGEAPPTYLASLGISQQSR